MNTYKCTDGFVEKTIEAETPQAAAEIYALVPCSVTVTGSDGAVTVVEVTPVTEAE
jgi:hypothetical protein